MVKRTKYITTLFTFILHSRARIMLNFLIYYFVRLRLVSVHEERGFLDMMEPGSAVHVVCTSNHQHWSSLLKSFILPPFGSRMGIIKSKLPPTIAGWSAI